MSESPLVQALKSRKKVPVAGSGSEQLLEQILAQVTKVADYFTADKEPDDNPIVTTQESHAP